MYKQLDQKLDKERIKTIPEHPFSLLICAGKSSGKSTLILNSIMDKKVWGKHFNDIIVINPTYRNDTKYENLTNEAVKPNTALIQKLKKEKSIKRILSGTGDQDELVINGVQFYDEYKDEIIQQVIDSQSAIRDNYGAEYLNKYLIILDDSIGSDLYKSTLFKHLWIASRNYDVSMIIVSQSYKAVNRLYRTNFSNIYLFQCPNNKELKMIYEENGCHLNEQDWSKIHSHATDEDFSFLHINYQNKKHLQMIKGYSHVLQLNKT